MSLRCRAAIAALAVLFAAVTNSHAHVHLCFDGQEPPAALHGAHEGNAHHEDETGDHDDLDVDVEDRAVAKSFKPELPTMAPTTTVNLAQTLCAALVPVASTSDLPSTDPPFFRPYLRAPPRNLA